MNESTAVLRVTSELQRLIDQFLAENDLRFEDGVANLYEFLSVNPVKVGEDQLIGEDDFTAYVAEATELPVLTNRNLQPSVNLLHHCQALGFRDTSLIPVLEQGPGIYLAHYDPFVVLPTCFHRSNCQLVLCSHSAYLRIQEAWQHQYVLPTGASSAVDQSALPTGISEWAEWHLANIPMPPDSQRILEGIRETASFEGAPAEWEYWYANKQKEEHCFSLGLVDFKQESKRINATTLKSLEAAILFENSRILQLGYVLNWDRFHTLETVHEQITRAGAKTQLFRIIAGDYSKFIEEQVNRSIQISRFIKHEDQLQDDLRDEIDPAQFTEEVEIRESDTQIKTIAEAILFAAYKRAASDILIEPRACDYRIRFTIDGINTVFYAGMPKNYGTSLIAHLKVRASMSITERRLPQDGKMTLHIKGNPVEIRAATMPVRDSSIVQEEKISLRMLNTSNRFNNLDRLGMVPEHLDLLRKALGMANGIIVVTGPTGSGKTTTLYAAILELDRERLNVVSLEDPIECFINDITQTQINDAIGLTFASGLRATLRQAPHVILLGEVRDAEVARIAVQAASTGHLVIATLHTNSAIGTFDRLDALGIEAHQIADAVRLIMAQRLVPRLCPVCRKSRKTTEMETIRIHKQTGLKLRPQVFFANYAGCRNCHKGYAGRRVITELIPVDTVIREMILAGRPHHEITQYAARYFGFRPLLKQAIELVNDGQVDLKDAQRLFLDFYRAEDEKIDG